MTEREKRAEPKETEAEISGYLLRPNWTLVGVAMGLVLLGVQLIASFSAGLGLFVAGAAAILAVTLMRGLVLPRLQRVALRFSHRTIQIGDRGPLLVSDIEEAKMIPHARGAVTVRLTVRRGSHALRLVVGDAVDLLRTTALLPGERRATFALMARLRSRLLTSFVVVSSPLVVLVGGRTDASFAALLEALLVAVPPATLLAWLAGLFRGRLVIGADGFTTKWLFRTKFFPFSEVTSVKTSKPVLGAGALDTLVSLRSGRVTLLRAAVAPLMLAQQHDEARALNTHLHAAFALASTARVAPQSAAQLLTSSRGSGKAWLAQVDELLHGGGTHYRVSALNSDLLDEIARDTANPTATRVGAAVAMLRGRDDGRATVRKLADACAEPVVRDALLSLSEPHTDDEIVEILEAVRRI